MKQFLENALKNADVDYIEIRIEETEASFVYYSGRELERIGTDLIYGGNIRACHKGGWGFISFNSLDKIQEKVDLCIRQSKLVKRDATQLAPVKKIVEKIKTNFDIDPRSISLAEKKDLCQKYNTMILKHPKIQSSTVVYRDLIKRKHYLNSADTCIDQELVHTGIYVGAIAKDGTNMQRSSKSLANYHGYENVVNYENNVEKVIKTAVDLLSAEKIDAGIYTVILDPQMTGLFAHEAFGHFSEADNLYENEELKKKMILGKVFGNDSLTIIDDGTLKELNGFIAYDDEGVKSKKNYLIKEGKLVGRLHSRETAAKMGETISGNARAVSYHHAPIVRMTNTYIDNGKHDFQEILASVDKGIYVKGNLAGMTDCEKFTFSSQEAYWIEKGKIGKMLRDVILSGNVFTTLKNIEMIGNDLTFTGNLGGCGKKGQSPLPISKGGPHIKIKDVVIGGK